MRRHRTYNMFTTSSKKAVRSKEHHIKTFQIFWGVANVNDDGSHLYLQTASRYRPYEPEIFFNVKKKFRQPGDYLPWGNDRYIARYWQLSFPGSDPGLAMRGVEVDGHVMIDISDSGGVLRWPHDDESNATNETDGSEEFASRNELSDSGEDEGDDAGDDAGNSSLNGHE